jgi:hypothetical protein
MFVWGDDCHDIDLKRFSQQEAGAMPANGIYKTLIEEYDLYQTLKLWYKNVLRRLDKLLCHCCRKTAYFWDYIRCEHDVNKLRLQAGHDNAKTADWYFNDTMMKNRDWVNIMPSSVPGARTVRASTIHVGSGKYHFQNWHVDSLKT